MVKICAHFYKVKSHKTLVGRLFLDIILDPKYEIDLLTIMLNPGSCFAEIDFKDRITCKVTPDPTLKRIIHMLKISKTFTNCRVINLSDIQEPYIRKVYKERAIFFNQFSIFSEIRRDEFDGLVLPNMKALLAWGKAAEKLEVSSKAKNLLKSKQIPILNENKTPYHPLVRKKGFSWTCETAGLLSHYNQD